MRGKGEGTIYKKGKAWIGQYTNPQGKRKTVSGKTRKEVQDKLTQALADLKNGCYREPSDMPLEAYFKEYMSNVKRQQVQTSTFDGYNETLERYFYGSEISGKALKNVTTDDLQKFYNRLMDEQGVGNRTVHYLYSILNQGFKYADKRKMISENHNQNVELPKKVKLKIKAPEPADIQKFLDYIKEDKWCALWMLIIFTGMRKSEALAIQKQDINFDTGEIQIHYSIGFVRNNGIVPEKKNNRVFVLKELMKSESSVGSVYVDRETLEEIKKLLAVQEEQKVENSDIYKSRIPFITTDNKIRQIDNDLLFTKEDGDVISGTVVLQRFQRLLKKAGINEKCTVHQLRHYFATQAYEATKDIALVSELCRHADIATTSMFYITHRSERKKNAMQDIRKKIAGA